MTILARWEGDCFMPIGRYVRQCDADYVVGQVYTLDVILERSDNTHRHYFASIRELWLNLPESIADQYPSANHLRKKSLIRAGYYNERNIVCSSPAEAERIAAFIEGIDDYAIVMVSDAVVRHLSAKSQSYRAMDKKEFAESKTKVLDIISDMIGVKPKEAERA